MRGSKRLVGVGVGCLLAALALRVDDEALAFKFYTTQEGAPLRWWQRPTLEFSLAQVVPQETPIAGVQALVETALDQWIDTPCGLVPDVAFGGSSAATRATTPKSLASVPDNVVVYITSPSDWAKFGNSPTWIAITKIAHDPDTGEIIDADVEINDGGYTFSYDDSPAADEVDFLSMLTHEAGHFFGLDHSANPNATMFATYASSPEDAMEARSLSQDDIDGICALYTDVPVHKDPGDGSEDCSAGGTATGLAGLLALVLALRMARARRRSLAA